MANRTDFPAGNNRAFSDSTVSRIVENKHVAKAGFVWLFAIVCVCM